MVTQSIAPDCTRKVLVNGARGHRTGQWVCRRCLTVLRDSLEIRIHMGLLRAPSGNVAVSRCSYGVTDSIQRIAFQCSVHGWEEA